MISISVHTIHENKLYEIKIIYEILVVLWSRLSWVEC